MKITKLGIKLFCFFLVVSLIPLGIAGGVVYKYIYEKTKDESLRQLQLNSHTVNEKLHLLLSKRIARLVDFSSDGFIRDSIEHMFYLPPEYSKIREDLNTHLLINKKSLDPDILEIEIVNHEGKVIASTLEEQVGKDKSHEDYFRTPFLTQEQRGPYFADTFYPSENTEALQLVFSTILTDKTFHKPMGVIVTKVKGDILQDMLEKTSFRHKGEIYILNSRKYVIASSVSYGVLNSKQMNSQEVEQALTSRGQVTGTCKNYMGSPVLCTALFVPETNWIIMSEKNIKDAFGQLVWIKYIFSISGGGALIMIILFAFFGSNSINKMVSKLMDGTRRIANGDLECPITIGNRKDELQELGESFNLMMEKLRESNENNIKHMKEIKFAESALLNSEKQLQSIMDNATAVIYLKDKQGKYILINRQYETLFHITREDIKGKTDMDIFPKEMAEVFQANDLKVLNACLPMELEEVAPHDDGPHTYISIKFPLFDSNGVPDRICGISTDITKRKRVEEQLRKLSRAVEQSHSTVVITDTKGNIEYVNPKFTQLTGYAPEEAIGKSPRILKSGKTLPEEYKRLWKTITSGAEWKGEFCNRKKNGELYWEFTSISPVKNEEGIITHFIAVKEDITKRKQVEEKLLSYQEQLKSLASSLSLAEERERRHIAEKLHDRIGQSLIVVKMKLESLRESKYSNGLNHILDDSYKLLERTIQDIRTMTFELSPPVLYELGFESALEWLAEQFQKHHDIVIDFATDGKSKPLDDDMRALLYRSVRELFFNIVKHADAHNVIVSIRKKENKIQIDVKDDGVGFNPHDASHSVTKTGGFGLFHVRERLEHFGGDLWIRSKPGHETKITLVAPLKCEEKKL